jgi:hypothetical protein
MRDKLANLTSFENESVSAAIARARAPFASARQALLEGYCAGVGIDLEDRLIDWRLSEDNTQLEPVEKPKENRAARRRKRAS